MTIAITGASGQLGRLVADQLLATVDPSEVVLLTRDPAKLADYAARGADVRAADFGNPEGLPDAFAGVERALLISTDVVGNRVEGHRAAIDAAAKAGVRHIAYTSVPEPTPDNPAGVVPDHAATEEALRESGLAWTMLRNNLYADMQVDTINGAAEAGQLVTNFGDGAAAYVTRADCAAVAVGVLTSEGHEGAAYDVTGPQAYTAADLATLAGERSGKPVEVVQVDDDTYAAGLLAAGLPDFLAPLMTSFGAATRLGKLANVTDVVERIGGRKPTPLATLL
ncbi:NAD(P)H dehydrogenase (quinone) [Nocardioides luteus]|uniref:NAD(P)-dependent oxidoreductase n=1 Tax=Nocardioides luteus TaxID=1844 RepID=A0ABQ5T0Z5_9ACTN|nr:SDR family oxidoreductase [Nocardioides luteus]MDR7311488.1 NAD(P)H dehydrogenase (quinone) [Nocardioides luteus]GGR55280.1 NAD(P)-dependent oxidoreductase [Nocardioides luteus]GLJ70138.1 NAD(P)-dependent oxidoreductase [Nocardioides luteus]